MEKYKPVPGAMPDCSKCDYNGCPNRGKFQRGKQGFTVLSGRCPRLPNAAGRYDPAWCDLENDERNGE